MSDQMKVARYYTCYDCKTSFTTKYKKPSCRKCGKKLKGTRKNNN